MQCDTQYDVEEIEHMLVAAVHRKSMAYVLQDLKCLKCRMVRPHFLSALGMPVCPLLVSPPTSQTFLWESTKDV